MERWTNSRVRIDESLVLSISEGRFPRSRAGPEAVADGGEVPSATDARERAALFCLLGHVEDLADRNRHRGPGIDGGVTS